MAHGPGRIVSSMKCFKIRRRRFLKYDKFSTSAAQNRKMTMGQISQFHSTDVSELPNRDRPLLSNGQRALHAPTLSFFYTSP